MDRRRFLASAVASVAGRTLADSGAEFRRRPGSIDVLADGLLVSGFVFADQWDKPFVYPLRTRSGLPLERGFPLAQRKGESADHPWHRGLIYGHGLINGTDFWRELGRDKSGRLAPLAEPKVTGNHISVRLSMQPPTGEPIGSIEQTYSFAVSGALVVIVAVIIVSADADVPLTFGDTEDGGFGMRLRDEFRQDRGAILRNSEGLGDTENIWGKPARWVDYTAQIDGQPAGITLYDHPKNLRYPSRWHARGYGLCTANPFALRDFTGDKSANGSHTIPAGAALTLRYRVVIHESADYQPENAGW